MSFAQEFDIHTRIRDEVFLTSTLDHWLPDAQPQLQGTLVTNLLVVRPGAWQDQSYKVLAAVK